MGTPFGPADFSRTAQVHKAHKMSLGKQRSQLLRTERVSQAQFIISYRHYASANLRNHQNQQEGSQTGERSFIRSHLLARIPLWNVNQHERTARVWQPSCGARPRAACDTQPKALLLQRGQFSPQSGRTGRFCAPSSRTSPEAPSFPTPTSHLARSRERGAWQLFTRLPQL